MSESVTTEKARELAIELSWCFKHFTPDEVEFAAIKLSNALDAEYARGASEARSEWKDQ